MVTRPTPHVYDELLEFLASRASPEDILAFQVSDEAEARAAYLSDKNNAGTLTLEEEIELQQLLHFDRKVGLLKARAALMRTQES